MRNAPDRLVIGRIPRDLYSMPQPFEATATVSGRIVVENAYGPGEAGVGRARALVPPGTPVQYDDVLYANDSPDAWYVRGITPGRAHTGLLLERLAGP